MIKLSLLEEKKHKTNIDNSLYPDIDLLSNVWVIDYDSIIIDDYIEVDQTSEMRIDTIARYLLGSENYSDVIMKFNKLDNVFDIKKGDIIMIPSLSSFFANIKKINYKPKNIVRDVLSDDQKAGGTTTSISVKTSSKGSKTYRKGTNGVIVF